MATINIILDTEHIHKGNIERFQKSVDEKKRNLNFLMEMNSPAYISMLVLHQPMINRTEECIKLEQEYLCKILN